MPDVGRILVVDDDPGNRYAVARMLRSEGHEVSEAGTGREGLARARSLRPDLVVLDVHLPDMIGFQVAELLRSEMETRNVGILHLSASYTSAGAQAHGLSRGADAYLVQPVEPQVLAATVHALLRLRRAERHAAELLEREQRARRDAEEARALAQGRAQELRFLADMLPQLVWTATPDGTLEGVNQGWTEYTGLGAEASTGRDWLSIVHPDDRVTAVARWTEIQGTGAPYESEARLRHGSGEYRWFLVRAAALRDEQGRAARWFGTCTNIDDSRRVREENARLGRELQAALHARDEFLAMASHDLRGPLSALGVGVELIRRKLQVRAPEAADLERSLLRAARQIHVMNDMFERLLDLSRLSSGLIELRREEMDLSEVVADVVDRMRDEAAELGVHVEVHVRAPLVGCWDRMRIEQVVSNLLANALKYGSRAPVELDSASDTDHVSISVRDHGPGIAPEDRQRIFQFFRRASELDHRSFGVGLWSVRRIVEAHGGSIQLESAPGEGATFTIRLPRRAVAPGPGP